VITDGCERVRIGGTTIVANVGSMFVVNPEEWHDGEAGGDQGWAYRTLYPSLELINQLAHDLGQAPDPVFPRRVLDDSDLASAFVAAHVSSEGHDPIAAEGALLECLRRLLLNHADRRGTPEPIEVTGARVRFGTCVELIERRITEKISLRHLAAAAGVTRFQVIRDFKAVAGPTPSAFIRDRRLRLAISLIRQGARLTDAAHRAGFADQSHLSRTFRRTHGITPGAFASAPAVGPIGRSRSGRHRHEK
jgi:AraC-like DNA-binding protein